MGDTLIVNGANCTWWDDITGTANTSPDRKGLPICPHCASPLYQHKPEKWWEAVDGYEAADHPGYRRFIEWLRGKCFRTYGEAKDAFAKAEGDA